MQQISELKKENFSLKLRIYYMEEKIQQKYEDDDDIKTVSFKRKYGGLRNIEHFCIIYGT